LFWDLRIFLGEAQSSNLPEALEIVMSRGASAAEISIALGKFVAQSRRIKTNEAE